MVDNELSFLVLTNLMCVEFGGWRRSNVENNVLFMQSPGQSVFWWTHGSSERTRMTFVHPLCLLAKILCVVLLRDQRYSLGEQSTYIRKMKNHHICAHRVFKLPLRPVYVFWILVRTHILVRSINSFRIVIKYKVALCIHN